ncbi:MAG: TetR/AcrR family transcriptional regulator C-terminal domain-containing protein [Oscillospiraceae bacterium]|nr:TetR/AcrR family transcriptional regulator C-terminal domain-containing protein [Oscillospiraceae bacterium]MBQ7123763.1 TetR/AcrR family transcriptional regulator C-terminal domain-containing protein [Oscillospiraceae bacterium]
MKELTKKAIADTFMELCETNKVEKITVRQIIETAGIAKQTFYRYFNDKADLMNFVYERQVKITNTRIFSSEKNLYDNSIDLLQYILKHKKYFSVIVDYETQNSFPNYFYDSAFEFYCNYLKKNSIDLTEENIAIISFNCAGAQKLLINWIKHGMKEEPEQVVNHIINCMPQKLKEYIKI